MGSITVAGPSNWRAAFEPFPGLAVTPENYDRLLAAEEPQPEPEAASGPVLEPEPAAEAAVPPRVPPRRDAAEGGG